MTNFRNMVAISATAACVAISQNADAQSDQLENLLDEKPAESADTTAESETSPTDNAATDDAVLRSLPPPSPPLKAPRRMKPS